MRRLPPAAELGDVPAQDATGSLFRRALLSTQGGATQGEQERARDQSCCEGSFETRQRAGLVSMDAGNGMRRVHAISL